MATDYILRPCTPGDEHALSLIGQATFLETFAGIIAGPDIIAHCRTKHAPELYAEWLARPTAALWLAETEQGRAPIGYLGLDEPHLPIPDPRPDDLELKRIYVLSRFHGTGLGAALMDRAVTAARELGRARLLLGVYAGNARALAFYERRGFRAVGERRFTIGHTTYDDLVLALPL